MKTLGVIAALQLVLLALVVYKLFLMEDRLSALASHMPASSTSTTPAEPAISRLGSSDFDEDRLRRIIRSELNSSQAALANDSKPAVVAATKQNIEIDPAENAAILEVAKQQLLHYISMGEISAVEMSNFQAEISRLNPESRKIMLRELARAINSGNLKGQF